MLFIVLILGHPQLMGGTIRFANKKNRSCKHECSSWK